MSSKQVNLLFLFSLIGIIFTYGIFLGKVKTIGLIIDQFTFIGILFVVAVFAFFYKKKLNGYPIIDFNKDSSMSFKNIVLFFLIFQIIDFIFEGGFIGMISMWFSYWVFGYIIFILLNIINYYKNIKLIHSGYYNQ